MDTKSYFDIFAGIGLLDYALISNNWNLELALDYEPKKFKIFENHFNGQSKKYVVKDIFELSGNQLPNVFLGHVSFPCTDVSSAGKRLGVQNGNQSSAIDSFLGTLYSKPLEERPSVLLTENVKGLLTSHDGKDIRYLLQHYNVLGYKNDILLVDAKHFVPQSRERVFIISTKAGLLPKKMNEPIVVESWMRPKSVMKVISDNKDLSWAFLKMKQKPNILPKLEDIIDYSDRNYWNNERTGYLLSQMPDKHKNWIADKLNKSEYHFATVFRRTRIKNGIKKSTAELRTDNLAGCLRTAKGGSAKQILVQVGKGEINIRLINALEAARLMGAPTFKISKDISLNDYLYAFGDGVCSSVIEWIDKNYLTPIFENRKKTHRLIIQNTIEMEVISKEESQYLSNQFDIWCNTHIDSKTNLPIKGRLYGALVVLHNMLTSSNDDPWSFENILNINSTDKSEYFGDRSIKNHTSHKINLALNTLNRSDLIPKSGGEAGRTSTGTKRAGLEIIQIINSFNKSVSGDQIIKKGILAANYLNSLIVKKLDEHASLGGIEVTYSPNETIGNFLSKIIHSNSSNPGAILQHLVGAKLELRFSGNPDVIVEHNKSATADIQTNRKGDFDIGNSVIHVTKTPTLDHFRKSLANAKSGRTTYLLIPEDKMGLSDLSRDIDSDYKSKVNLFSVEQFLAQNIDEIGQFRKDISIRTLESLLLKYNELVEKYENDSSLKIVIPDFGN